MKRYISIALMALVLSFGIGQFAMPNSAQARPMQVGLSVNIGTVHHYHHRRHHHYYHRGRVVFAPGHGHGDHHDDHGERGPGEHGHDDHGKHP